MRWPPAVLLCLCLPLAGCFAECGASYDRMDWNDPGFYASIHEGGAARWSAGGGALPWNVSLAGQEWPGARLSSIVEDPVRPQVHSRGLFLVEEPNVRHLQLVGHGVLEALVVGNLTEPELRPHFDAAIAMTDLDSNETEVAWREFLASRVQESSESYPVDEGATTFEESPVWSYSLDLSGSLRLDPWIAGQTFDVPSSGEVGAATAHSRTLPWSLGLSLPTWNVHGDRGELRVDSTDHVKFEGRETSQDAFRDAALETAALVGRTPDLTGVSPGGTIC